MAGRYWVGVDVGTTFTAAAVRRDGRTEVVQLGSGGAAIPSVLLLREDGEMVTGEVARRRAVSEPDRVASAFKRRVGDPVPVLVGGTPFAAETLVARLVRWVVDTVAAREGGPPSGIGVTHPANWGPYKLDLLANALRTAGVDGITYLSEPAAAARQYASHERLPDGAVVAVYDLGGGTFDACVLRKEPDGGFALLGQPEGIERLGGLDLDEAVLGHVQRSADDLFVGIDADDPTTRGAFRRLREECTGAKEQLSGDVDATIPVLLPGRDGRDVRITRSEFEGLVRPLLSDTLGCVQRSLTNAGVTADDLHAVLLVGGSSRVPLVGQLVAAGLGRPVAVDADPKLAVAQGAALAAEAAAADVAEPVAAPVASPFAAPVVAAVAEPVAEPEAEPAAGPAAEPVAEPVAAPPAEPVAAPVADPVAAPFDLPPEPPAPAFDLPPTGSPPGRRTVVTPRKRWPVVAAGLALAALAAAAVVFLLDGDPEDPVETGTDDTSTTETSDGTDEGASFTFPENGKPFVHLTGAALVDGNYEVSFETNFNSSGADTLDGPNFHMHFFWDVDPAAASGNVSAQAGTNGEPEPCFCWFAYGGPSPAVDPTKLSLDGRPQSATLICALVATPGDDPEGAHRIADVDGDGFFDPGTGDCVDVSGLEEGDSVTA